ncbi:hypothetical protein D3C83_56420 [compost metagenome]
MSVWTFNMVVLLFPKYLDRREHSSPLLPMRPVPGVAGRQWTVTVTLVTYNVALCGAPRAMTPDAAQPWRPVRSSSGLADQLVVLGMRPDPEPDGQNSGEAW